MKSITVLFKNKIFLAVVVFFLVIGVVVVFVSRSTSQENTSSNFENEKTIKQISPEDVGLVLMPKKNGQVINMQIKNIEGIASIEYDLTYDAQVEDSRDMIVIARGVTGGPLEPKGKPVNIDIDLGTCSRNVCKYDKVVSDVKVILRINFENGEIGGVETTVSLDS